MRILISGGFGLLAGRLAKFFAEDGHTVMLGSRSEKAKPTWLQAGDLLTLDWTSMDSLRAACTAVDVVIHAAGMNAGDCEAMPTDALLFNGVGTSRFLEAAIASGVKQFIYLSTAHVYSDNLIGHFNENSATTNLHPYATSHKAGEDVVRYANKQKRIKGAVLRLSNAFGYPLDKETNCWMLLMNDLCKQAVVEKSLTLHSNGMQHRDFISIVSVCETVLFLTQNYDFEMPSLLNVASGYSNSVIDMTKIVQVRCEQILGYTPSIHRQEAGLDQTYASVQLETRSLKDLGYSTKTDLIAEIDALLLFAERNFK
jgi:UDP-glucose 4-epimerase